MTDAAIRRLVASERGQAGLDRIVDLAHRHLGLDLVYVAELIGDRLLFRAVAGDSDTFNVALDGGASSEGTYTRLLVEG